MTKSKFCLKEFIRYTAFNILGMMGVSCYIFTDTYFVSMGWVLGGWRFR